MAEKDIRRNMGHIPIGAAVFGVDEVRGVGIP